MPSKNQAQIDKEALCTKKKAKSIKILTKAATPSKVL
jgi:hypothetical protein